MDRVGRGGKKENGFRGREGRKWSRRWRKDRWKGGDGDGGRMDGKKEEGRWMRKLEEVGLGWMGKIE